jgi:hypothetical protein
MRLFLVVLTLTSVLVVANGAKDKSSHTKTHKKNNKDHKGVDGDLADVVDEFQDEEDMEFLTLTTLDDVKNSTSCADLGYSDLSQYQYMYPVDPKYTVLDGITEDLFLPILSTHDLEKKNKNVKKVLVAIHGKEGDVDTYFCLAKYAADLYALRHGKEKDEVAVIAPWFSEEQYSGLDWGGDNSKSSAENDLSVYWTSSNWIR